MAGPADNSFTGGLQGGFLLQNNGRVSGEVVYSITLPQTSSTPATLCNSGSAPVTGIVSGQNVNLAVAAGGQSFNLTGTLTSDGSTMTGTYTSSAGQSGCGTAQSGLKWSATSVPPLAGAIQGFFHSVTSGSVNINLHDQDFPVTGFLTQGENIGASNATVTGALNFQGYPCLSSASVNGQISGSSVILQIIAGNGLNVGQIGAPAGSSTPSPVLFQSSAGGGFVLQGSNGYGVSTKACPGGNSPGDMGNICFALGNSTSCTQPVLLSPSSLSFPPQLLASVPSTQIITLTNNDPSGSTLNGLSLQFQSKSGTNFAGQSDFNGLPNFTEQDNCSSTPGGTFSLASQQSCSINITFAPQESCPWLPFGTPPSLAGAVPSQCPFPLGATLTVQSPTSADADKSFAVPVTGIGMSVVVPSTPELDFGAEAVSETSPPQTLSFTNEGQDFAVQILRTLSQPCTNPPAGQLTLPRPLIPGAVPGLQVVTGGSGGTGTINPNAALDTINYNCDSAPVSKQPNFQISADTCSGTFLLPQSSCSIQVSFAPEPGTSLVQALDYFLELNTLQCTSNTTVNCEIDSGRFPVELKANAASPLRMSPGAGLDFGTQQKGTTSAPLTITLSNDPNDPHSGTVTFTGNQVRGDYNESDNCGASLAPGGSCTLTITFTPQIVGFDQGTLTISYGVGQTFGQTQTVTMRGTGQ